MSNNNNINHNDDVLNEIRCKDCEKEFSVPVYKSPFDLLRHLTSIGRLHEITSNGAMVWSCNGCENKENNVS